MKISILTPTYNRGDLLKKVYDSLIENSKYDVQIEWLIMDDGSKDETQEIVNKFKKEERIEINYYHQKNQGKMVSINNLVSHATGDLIVTCDSDDYFTSDAFKIIKDEYEKNKSNNDNVYALCFLKNDSKGENIGKDFNKNKTTMFELYFKESENGEKALVFYANIRKKYKHELENGEKFITEARMYHKMDEKYEMVCINKPIMICEYKDDGYTKNISKQFKENPYGYYKYFQEILQKDMSGVRFKKRLYVIKHYILFSYLTKQYTSKGIKNLQNKIWYYILILPGIIKSHNYSI